MRLLKYNKNLFHLINLVIALQIFRTGFPVFKYVSLVLFLIITIYLFFQNSLADIVASLQQFLNKYTLVLIAFLPFLLASILPKKVFISSLKEIVDFILLLSTLFISYSVIKNKSQLNSFLNSFIKVTTILSIIVSIIIIQKDFHINSIPLNTAPLLLEGLNKFDYNFALIPVFIAIGGITIYIFNTINSKRIYLANILLFLFAIRIFLSGSRRGIIIFSVILLVFFIINIIGLLKRNSSCRNFVKKFSLFSILLSLLFFISYFFYTQLPYTYKNDMLRLIGVKDLSIVKPEISRKLYKYTSVYNERKSFNEFHEQLWAVEFNPLDPDSGWGRLRHKSIFPLTGKNVEIVPKNTIGYQIDSTSGSCNDQPDYYCDLLTPVFKIKVTQGNEYKAYVFCYVSDEFNGISARITTGWQEVDSGIIDKISTCRYNLEEKECWQILEININCIKSGELPVYLTVNRQNPIPFEPLKGYVTFAYPNFNKKTATTAIYRTNQEDKIKTNRQELLIKARDNNSTDIISGTKYNVNFMSISSILNQLSFLTINNTDPFLKYFSKWQKSDTTYYPYSADLNTEFEGIDLTKDRISRWNFAIEIFRKEYNLSQKLFGKSFYFLNWYGLVFKKDKYATDYPHNPFLHILLYSGIFGVLLYLFVLYKVVSLYWKYRKEYPMFFVFFLITYYFTFFSGGNPFNPPMMGYFMMLPFLIDLVYRYRAKNIKIAKTE